MNERFGAIVPRYVDLAQMTLGESTDYEYEISLSGYHVKLAVWGLLYMENHQTGIPQLDLPKSMWSSLRNEIVSQVDGVGSVLEPNVVSENHLDVIAQILDRSDAN